MVSLSALNWKRGLLRLWAVAAVLWVCVAFYSNDSVQRVRDAYAPFEFKYHNEAIEISANTNLSTATKIIRKFIVEQRKKEKWEDQPNDWIPATLLKGSLEELASALRAADASGNVEVAHAIARLYRAKQGQGVTKDTSGHFDLTTAIPAQYADFVDEAAKMTPDRAAGYVINAHNFQPMSIWPPLFDFAKLAFIPPLLLLALGYVGLWVGRGFRR